MNVNNVAAENMRVLCLGQPRVLRGLCHRVVE